MIRQSVLLELEKQKAKYTMDQQKENQFKQSKISIEEKVKIHKSLL